MIFVIDLESIVLKLRKYLSTKFRLEYVCVCRFSCIHTVFWVYHVLNHYVFRRRFERYLSHHIKAFTAHFELLNFELFDILKQFLSLFDTGGRSADDLDDKLWWIILVIILLLFLLLLLLLLLYCCCCRKNGQECCPCCFACFDKYCLPCLACCCPCCCKDKKA